MILIYCTDYITTSYVFVYLIGILAALHDGYPSSCVLVAYNTNSPLAQPTYV